MGDRFGPYELDQLLGRGGMGEVYRAVDTRKGRAVALKRLRPSLTDDPTFQERFRREAEMTARLTSPHVIPIHDYGVIDDSLFIDMRLAEGTDFASLLARRGALPWERAVEIVAQVGDALDAAHEHGLVHRDVKPSNVMITEHRGRDFVYLVDFGIVRALGATAQSSLTATGAALGTLAYMAPELFTGAGPDHRVDIYALGCLLYEALTGRPPFAHDGPALMYDHLHTPPPAPSESRPGLPYHLDVVVARAMAKDPGQRFRAASDLARSATSDSPIADRPGEPGVRDKGPAIRAGSYGQPEMPRPVGPKPTRRDDTARNWRPFFIVLGILFGSYAIVSLLIVVLTHR